MSHLVPLTPVQEQLVRDLLSSGRFHSEDEIVQAAFQLLKVQAAPRDLPANVLTSSGRRSPYGLFADIRSDISEEDIAEARREMWGNFANDRP